MICTSVAKSVPNIIEELEKYGGSVLQEVEGNPEQRLKEARSQLPQKFGTGRRQAQYGKQENIWRNGHEEFG